MSEHVVQPIDEAGANKVAVIQNWLDERAALQLHKADEMKARTEVSQLLFPNPTKGTQRYPLANGYAIKLVYKLNYRLGDKDKINPDTGGKVRLDDQVFDLQSRMEALGPVAELFADRLIKWTPELSVTEYEKLDVNDPIQRQLRDMIDAMLTVEPASPALDFEEPKGSK